MTNRLLRPAAAAGALALLLAGCSPDSTPSASPTPTASQTSVSPTPTSTLAPAEQEALDQATDVVVAYQQTIVDLYTGARTDVNDLNAVVATGDLLDASLKSVSQGLSLGYRMEPANAQVVLVSAEPVGIELEADPVTVVVRACLDQSAITSVSPDGSTKPGVREEVDYTVVKTDYLPAPGWAVESMEGDPDAEDRAC
jgi:hypothetical protein